MSSLSTRFFIFFWISEIAIVMGMVGFQYLQTPGASGPFMIPAMSMNAHSASEAYEYRGCIGLAEHLRYYGADNATSAYLFDGSGRPLCATPTDTYLLKAVERARNHRDTAKFEHGSNHVFAAWTTTNTGKNYLFALAVTGNYPTRALKDRPCMTFYWRSSFLGVSLNCWQDT